MSLRDGAQNRSSGLTCVHRGPEVTRLKEDQFIFQKSPEGRESMVQEKPCILVYDRASDQLYAGIICLK